MAEPGTRAGFVAVLGAPNVGKSTLVNQLVGAKVTIVSPRVQTTRTRLRGIRVEGEAQIVFVEWLDPHAEVVHVVRRRTRRRAALPSEHTRHVDEVDDGIAGAQLVQADLIVHVLDGAAEHRGVEGHAALDIGDSQHDVVERRQTEHLATPRGLPTSRTLPARVFGLASGRCSERSP